jgi:hypothetical protein
MDLKICGNNLMVVAGRPSSGKTRWAMRLAEEFLQRRNRVVFYQAEGPEQLEETEFEFRGPDDLVYLDYIPDIFTTDLDLLSKVHSLGRKHRSLIVVDTLELFDCDPLDFLTVLRTSIEGTQISAVVLTQIPRHYEAKPRECAEKYVRKLLCLNAQEEVIILGDFPIER